MKDGASSRLRDMFKICSMICVTALVVGIAVPVAATAAAQLFMLVGPSGDKAKVSDNGALKVSDGDGAMTVGGTVEVKGEPIVRPKEAPFSRVAHIDLTSSAETSGCETLELPASGKVVLKSALATTYYPPTAPTAYLVFGVKGGGGAQYTTTQRVPLTSQGSNPLDHTRSGVLNFEATAVGGGSNAAAPGEIYSIEVCLAKASDENAVATFQVSGTRVP